MSGTEYLTVSLRLATVVVPVAVYFLILGLLNTRGHPQLLTGRRDFALLIVALSPLFVLPVLGWLGVSGLTVVLVVAVVAGCIWLLAPREGVWVVYNLPQGMAYDVVARALKAMGLGFERAENGFRIPSQNATVEISGFWLLCNVSVRLRGGEGLGRRFEEQLARTLASVRVEASPMAIAMLLVATGLLVAPLTLVAHRAGEIVRILTDLLY